MEKCVARAPSVTVGRAVAGRLRKTGRSVPVGGIRLESHTQSAGAVLTRRAAPCRPSECQLPDCFCSPTGTDIPGGLPASRTPQMIIITVDDAVTGVHYNVSALFASLRNRNQCPVRATFFVSHEYTAYDVVERLAFDGHEIGVNSIT